ncbi:MAG: carboxypeptidase-like regulatory domain-containing protein, partial [Bacteroidales bacterium]|nr:carboxypeptidase-like regulatory domain-containing protein [Bacteroidales bacterium]
MQTFLKLIAAFLMLTSLTVKAQNLTQTIKGRVLDKASQSGIPGAAVVIAGTSPLLAAGADADGNFRIANVPVGR